MAKSLMAQGRWAEAIEQFEAISVGLKNDPDLFKARFAGDVDWAIALLATGRNRRDLDQRKLARPSNIKPTRPSQKR